MDISRPLRVFPFQIRPKNQFTKLIISSSVILLLCSTLSLCYLAAEGYVFESKGPILAPEDAQAPRLATSDLISRPILSEDDLYTIPKYIHQSWMSDKLPGRLSRWSRTCRSQNNDWEWLLWNDEDNLRMVKTYFPWFLDTFLSLPAEINRADASRNMYMYVFGGVYADLDTECLQSFDHLFQAHNIELTGSSDTPRSESTQSNSEASQIAIFGRMGYDGTDNTLFHTIPNAWMAASPGHPFFLLVLERLQSAMTANQQDKYNTTAEDLTGPIALHNAIHQYNTFLADDSSFFTTHFATNPSYALFNRTSTALRMEILPPTTVFPYAWNNHGIPHRSICWAGSWWFNPEKCKRAVATNQSYAITYWSHTWSSDLHQTHNKQNIEHL